MGKTREHPLDSVCFRCTVCAREFSASPARTVDDPSRPWHPFEYFASCNVCGGEAVQTPAERGRLKAWAHATGPVTPEGKARSAENLAGHPTPEETRITRLNALKHGRFAQTASYFPARPGRYPHCNGCRYYGEECVETPPPEHKNPAGCLLRTELYLRHQIAFESRDPGMLTDIRAGTQAALQALIDDMITAIAADGGPRIQNVEWYYDKDGVFHLARWRDENGDWQQIYKLDAHPLLRPLIDYVQKNAMTLADMGMTPKVQDESDLLAGFLKGEQDNSDSAQEYRQKSLQQQQQLIELIRGSAVPAGKVIDAEVISNG